MKKTRLALVTILAAALCLGGCGSSSVTSAGSYKEGVAADSYEYDFAAEESLAMGSGELNTADSGSDDSVLRAQDGQKIVYTGNLKIQTLEYDKSAASIKQKIREAGGFSEAESERDNNYNWYSNGGGSGNTRYLSITARIPSDRFESFMNSLSGDGKVMSRSVNAENISQVYANKETYKKALEKEQERLLAMMDKAESIEDMIAVESRLSEVERQLNSYKTDLAQMDKDVEYSTVYIELEEVKRYTEQVNNTTFAERLKFAFEDAISSFKGFCEGVILFVVRNFPYLILLAIILILVLRAIAKGRARKLAMLSDPEYAKLVNAKARAKAEAEAKKRAEKEAKRRGRKGVFGKKTAQEEPAQPQTEETAQESVETTLEKTERKEEK